MQSSNGTRADVGERGNGDSRHLWRINKKQADEMAVFRFRDGLGLDHLLDCVSHFS